MSSQSLVPPTNLRRDLFKSLPSEILEIIVHIHHLDESLHNRPLYLAVLSREFVHPSRHRLFTEVEIRSPKALDSFVIAIAQSQCLANYVRRFTVRIASREEVLQDRLVQLLENLSMVDTFAIVDNLQLTQLILDPPISVKELLPSLTALEIRYCGNLLDWSTPLDPSYWTKLDGYSKLARLQLEITLDSEKPRYPFSRHPTSHPPLSPNAGITEISVSAYFNSNQSTSSFFSYFSNLSSLYLVDGPPPRNHPPPLSTSQLLRVLPRPERILVLSVDLDLDDSLGVGIEDALSRFSNIEEVKIGAGFCDADTLSTIARACQPTLRRIRLGRTATINFYRLERFIQITSSDIPLTILLDNVESWSVCCHSFRERIKVGGKVELMGLFNKMMEDACLLRYGWDHRFTVDGLKELLRTVPVESRLRFEGNAVGVVREIEKLESANKV